MINCRKPTASSLFIGLMAGNHRSRMVPPAISCLRRSGLSTIVLGCRGFALVCGTSLVISCVASDWDDVDADADGFRSEADCDDTDGTTYPGAAHNESSTDCMTDEDADGWGDDSPVQGVVAGSDCDDSNAALNPASSEDACDYTDNDCDGALHPDETDDDRDGFDECEGDCDDTDASSHPADLDEDGFDPCGGDCDDSSVFTYPGAAARDSVTDCMTDEDGDGWGDSYPADGVSAGSDCADSDAQTYPGVAANESPVDCMTDADGDGWGDDSPIAGVAAGSDCADGDSFTYPGIAAHDSATDCMTDEDGDGWGDDSPVAGVAAGSDCADRDSFTHPGIATNDSATDCMTDEDGDGWGDDVPAAGVVHGEDCDDSDALTYPGAAFNESDTACMTDHDADGWGNEGPAGGVIAGTDCDDGDGAMNLDDSDGDGYDTCDGDCDDGDAGLNLDDLDGDGSSTCDGDYDDGLDCTVSSHDSHTYHFCRAGLTWEDAQTACEGRDAYLATISSSAENDWTAGMADTHLWAYHEGQVNLSQGPRIGLNDRTAEGAFVWLNGESVHYTNWRAGEPNNSANEDCVAIDFGAGGTWNDVDCSTLGTFICEAE